MTNEEIDRVDLLIRARIDEAGRLAGIFARKRDIYLAGHFAWQAAHGARKAWPELFVWTEGQRHGQQFSFPNIESHPAERPDEDPFGDAAA